MPRLSVTLSDSMYSWLSSLAIQNEESMSNVINQLIHLGMQNIEDKRRAAHRPVEKHCHQLIIQMNALVKNLSAEILKFDQNDFEKLREATAIKYNELEPHTESELSTR